jgi:hypothetical protein
MEPRGARWDLDVEEFESVLFTKSYEARLEVPGVMLKIRVGGEDLRGVGMGGSADHHVNGACGDAGGTTGVEKIGGEEEEFGREEEFLNGGQLFFDGFNFAWRGDARHGFLPYGADQGGFTIED